ncbi:hypothetical protein OBBRIDRAFT_183228 [Obba rivulosa]|uniref:Uncharacterized protein n=1 Tax=Obba rivulosa TaxID=1052685 RepID=A0A8E2AMR1_9APHY|nr:hypothetical protein OBBRIDRAFT_183228 [Obba rivulosa]
MKTYAIYREAARNNVKTPLMALFLEDGTLYFIMLLSLNLLSVIGRITNIFIFTQSDFITPISSIITTHFLLNLRQLGAAPPDDSTNTTLAFASVQEGGQASSWRSRLSFNTSFVDNMGEDLVHTFDLSSSTHGVVPIEESNNEGYELVIPSSRVSAEDDLT